MFTPLELHHWATLLELHLYQHAQDHRLLTLDIPYPGLSQFI